MGSSKDWRLANPEKHRANQKFYKLTNRDKVSEYNREYVQRKRKIVIEHYSKGQMNCACCKEDIYEFLAIDHIGGWGKYHRETKKCALAVYMDLIKRNFPEGIQILCHNCNQAKEFYGECPHKL